MILITALLKSFRALADRSISIVFETNELPPDQVAEISRHLQSFGFLAFKKDEFKSEQIKLLDESKVSYEDNTKTPSKRLRDVLFVAWKQSNQGYENFEDYYKFKIELFINHIKSKLD